MSDYCKKFVKNVGKPCAKCSAVMLMPKEHIPGNHCTWEG